MSLGWRSGANTQRGERRINSDRRTIPDRRAPLIAAPLPPPLWEPTPRQLQVLALIAAGNTYKETAKKLHLSTATVKNHMEEVRRNLGAKNSVHMIAECFARGWLIPNR